MKSKKVMILIAITILIINLFTGCRNNSMDKIYNNNRKIVKEYDTFGLDESEETVELGSYKGNFKLNGCATIWKYESSKEFDFQVSYTLLVKSGKAKIVLISPDNTVTTLIENTDKKASEGTTILTVPIKKGLNRIKIVGYKKSHINIKLNIDKGTFKKIDF